MKKIANDIMNTGIAVFFGTLFLLVALVTAQSIERQFMPVVRDMELRQQGVEMVFDVKGTKARPCKFKELRALVKNHENYEKADIIFLAVTKTSSSRGLGYQSFGRWRIIPPGDVVKIEAVHQCHPFWDSITEIGEFKTIKG